MALRRLFSILLAVGTLCGATIERNTQRPQRSQQELGGVIHSILSPVGGVPSKEENRALSQALTTYKKAGKIAAVEPFESFLKQYPNSSWRAFVHATLGLIYRETGQTVKAQQAFEEVLNLCEGSRVPKEISLATFALAEYSDLFPAKERRAAMQKVSMRSQARLEAVAAQGGGWDAENRLLGVKKGSHTSEFEYDGLGRRTHIVEKENGVVVSDLRYLWVGNEIALEQDAQGNVTRRFFTQGFTIGETPYYYTKDHLGSIREVMDASGTVRARYDYDPWGRPTKLMGDIDSPFLFTGHFWHSPTGLYLAQYRAYDPSLGRWISRDPAGIADGLNMYAYVSNDPINMLDPDGMAGSPWAGANGVAGIIPANNGANSPLIDSAILLCMMARESHFDPDAGIGTTHSGKGLLGVSEDASSAVNFEGYYPEIPEWNIQAGSQYLGYLLNRYGGGTNIHKALVGYRMGPHSKDKKGNGNRYANAIEDCAKCIRENGGKCKDGCFNKTLGRGM
ncbi:MAG: transglycosylase SLT domain-containing protein [Acidobacteria bacterium]|nr:transglycosylase SLT domain-containing protein [Acidobacteriota bacterium]